MKKLLFLIFITCLLFVEQNIVRGQQENPKAYLFDSYGEVGYEGIEARLDNFAIQLQKDLNIDAYVVCYGPANKSDQIADVTKNYLVNRRGIDANRLQTVAAGRYKNPAEIQTELWLVPNGVKSPEAKRYKGSLKKFTGKFAEYEGWDGFPDAEYISLGNIELAAFVDLLQHQTNTIAYIAAYNKHDATPGTWRRVANRDVAELQNCGIPSDRIKIIFGGTVKKEKDEYGNTRTALIQLWILPKDAPPPVKEANPESTPKKAVLIGTYEDYLLKYREQERTVFTGFADVLRANEQLNVYIVTRPRIEALEKLSPDDPPNIEPVKLADEWKTELVEKTGIKANRITVINATADEIREGNIEVWIAPPGVALPDPNASNEETTGNENPKML